MDTNISVFNLKGQARRLAGGLADLGMTVSHSQSLDLVARMQGKRSWKELQGLAQAAPDPSGWLRHLMFALRMSGRDEQSLDELVHEALGGEAAASVNNQGMAEQLAVLLEHHEGDRQSLVGALQAELGAPLAVPEGADNAPPALRATVSMCAGFPEETTLVFDALEWALQASPRELATVEDDGLGNSSATDEVALWVAEHGTDARMKARVAGLLAAMRTVCELKPDRTGITVHIDKDDFGRFAGLRRQFARF